MSKLVISFFLFQTTTWGNYDLVAIDEMFRRALHTGLGNAAVLG